MIGQDPAQHEVIARRALVGTAGRRVQGFLTKLGVESRYVILNAFLYSVYGQQAGARHIEDPAITEYRNRRIQAVIDASQINAVLTFGSLASKAWKEWLASPQAAGGPALNAEKLLHPTYPEARGGNVTAAIKTMLDRYNAALLKLRLALGSDSAGDLYGNSFTPGDLAPVPQRDLPAGIPIWMGTDNEWATRVGTKAKEKRLNILVTARG